MLKIIAMAKEIPKLKLLDILAVVCRLNHFKAINISRKNKFRVGSVSAWFSRHMSETFALSELDHHLPGEISVDSRSLSSNSSTTYSPVTTRTFPHFSRSKLCNSSTTAMPTEAVLSYEAMNWNGIAAKSDISIFYQLKLTNHKLSLR